jgi:hypothetical protein
MFSNWRKNTIKWYFVWTGSGIFIKKRGWQKYLYIFRIKSLYSIILYTFKTRSDIFYELLSNSRSSLGKDLTIVQITENILVLSSFNKTCRHDTAEILLNVAVTTPTLSCNMFLLLIMLFNGQWPLIWNCICYVLILKVRVINIWVKNLSFVFYC